MRLAQSSLSVQHLKGKRGFLFPLAFIFFFYSLVLNTSACAWFTSARTGDSPARNWEVPSYNYKPSGCFPPALPARGMLLYVNISNI